MAGEGRGDDSAGPHYVQVRYPRGDRWVTVARANGRREAARQAALVFPDTVDAMGLHAMQVRVIGSTQLHRHDGAGAVGRADDDLVLRRAVEDVALGGILRADPDPA